MKAAVFGADVDHWRPWAPWRLPCRLPHSPGLKLSRLLDGREANLGVSRALKVTERPAGVVIPQWELFRDVELRSDCAGSGWRDPDWPPVLA